MRTIKELNDPVTECSRKCNQCGKKFKFMATFHMAVKRKKCDECLENQKSNSRKNYAEQNKEQIKERLKIKRMEKRIEKQKIEK